MQISEYMEYLIVNRIGTSNSYEEHIVKGDKLFTTITELTINLSRVRNFEIYTRCPKTGVTGWEIELVRSTPELIRTFPNFDVVISVDDCIPTQNWFFLQSINNT